MKHLLLKNETKAAVYANPLTFARHKRIALKSILGGLAFTLLLGMSHSSFARGWTKDVTTPISSFCMNDMFKQKDQLMKIGFNKNPVKGITDDIAGVKVICAMPWTQTKTKRINQIKTTIKYKGVQPQVYRGNRARLKFDEVTNDSVTLQVTITNDNYKNSLTKRNDIARIMIAVQDKDKKLVATYNKRIRLPSLHTQKNSFKINFSGDKKLKSDQNYTITAQLRRTAWFDIKRVTVPSNEAVNLGKKWQEYIVAQMRGGSDRNNSYCSKATAVENINSLSDTQYADLSNKIEKLKHVDKIGYLLGVSRPFNDMEFEVAKIIDDTFTVKLPTAFKGDPPGGFKYATAGIYQITKTINESLNDVNNGDVKAFLQDKIKKLKNKCT
jgi:hypothetical protein